MARRHVGGGRLPSAALHRPAARVRAPPPPRPGHRGHPRRRPEPPGRHRRRRGRRPRRAARAPRVRLRRPTRSGRPATRSRSPRSSSPARCTTRPSGVGDDEPLAGERRGARPGSRTSACGFDPGGVPTPCWVPGLRRALASGRRQEASVRAATALRAWADLSPSPRLLSRPESRRFRPRPPTEASHDDLDASDAGSSLAVRELPRLRPPPRPLRVFAARRRLQDRGAGRPRGRVRQPASGRRPA